MGSATHTRRKDRISYSHEEFSIDLTQVASYGAPGAQVGHIKSVEAGFSLDLLQSELLHELELEFANPQLLTAAAAKRGDENSPELERSAFDELVRAFVNNARILARNASGGWQ